MTVLWLVLLGCPADSVDTAVLPEPEAMEPGMALTRLSLDLRGRRPTVEELAAVRSDPGLLGGFAQSFADDPAFGERLIEWYATVYKTRADQFIPGINGSASSYTTPDRLAFARGIGEEPLRILARIGTADLAYTQAVVGDWTVVNDAILDVAENLEVSPDDTGVDWHVAAYTDLRPPVGVLASNGMWWRYTSTEQNHNRGRAAAVLQTLLCDERFDQPVVFATDLEELDALDDLVQDEPACISCHVVLDPVGSYLFGFRRLHVESGTEALYYFPEREGYWTSGLEVPPSYYGSAADEGLSDLGARIASDPRFVSCAVEQAWGFLHGEAAETDQIEALSAHRQTFLDAGLTLDALYVDIATDPSHLSQDETVAGTVPPKRLSPEQMASAVHALTGYAWTTSGVPVMHNDELGYRVLAGGMDGAIVTQAASDHTAAQALVLQRLSELGAANVVEEEAALDRDARRLFTEVDSLDAVPDDAALQAQIIALGLVVLGQQWTAEDDAVTELVALHQALTAVEDDPAQVWRAVLTALLRHPDFVHY